MVSLPNESRSDMALRLLRARLRRPDMGAGTRLPPERTLAGELAVGRRAVRHALARLEAEGTLQRRPGAGTVIREPSRITARRDKAIRHYTSPRELMDARQVMEPGIAALAAANATSADLQELNRCRRRAEAVKGHQAWERWDSALHRAIGRASHNALLGQLFDLLNAARSHTEWGRLRSASLTAERQALYTREHHAIIAAIEDRDSAGAAQAMRDHLQTVASTLLGLAAAPLANTRVQPSHRSATGISGE